MKQATITLYLNLTDEASHGAGWYVVASSDEGVLIKGIPVPPEAASGLAGAFLTALNASDEELPSTLPSQIVDAGNALIRQSLEAQLRTAEEAAAKIAMLRRKLAHIQGPSGMIPQTP